MLARMLRHIDVFLYWKGKQWHVLTLLSSVKLSPSLLRSLLHVPSSTDHGKNNINKIRGTGFWMTCWSIVWLYNSMHHCKNIKMLNKCVFPFIFNISRLHTCTDTTLNSVSHREKAVVFCTLAGDRNWKMWLAEGRYWWGQLWLRLGQH